MPSFSYSPAAPAKSVNKARAGKQLLKYLKEYRARIIIAILFSFIGVMLYVIGPFAIKLITEEILDASTSNQWSEAFAYIMNVGIICAVTYSLSFIINYSSVFLMSHTTARVSKKFRTEISIKINNLPLNYFDTRSTGDLLSIVTNDVDTIGQTLNQTLSQMMTSIFLLLGVTIMMFVVEWSLALIAVIALPISLLLMFVIAKQSQKYFSTQQGALAQINGHAEEIYNAHEVVVSFRGKKQAIEKFDDINNQWKKSAFKSSFFSGLMVPTLMFVGNLTFTIICIVGGYKAISISSSATPDVVSVAIANIVACVTYSKQLTSPLSSLATIAATLQQTLAASERVFDFLKADEQENEQGKSLSFENVKGEVEFKNVVFGYNEDKIIIHNFSDIAKPGQKIAIVGPTGAGKTTMVNLLMRFYEINSGEILIDGKTTKDAKRADVRKLFGMVLQDTWLFAGTIKENLKFGRRDATDEEIIEACVACHCDEFIRKQPGGYDMLLTEDSGFSSGQKQLLTIARAMIQNAPMLILDEATSSVDTRTEVQIQEAMDKLTHGRTSFVIAHRLSTIKNSDKILVMKDGDVIESGNHDELMKQKGFYSGLYNAQFANQKD